MTEPSTARTAQDGPDAHPPHRGGDAVRRLIPAAVGGAIVLAILRYAAQQAGLFGASVSAWVLAAAMTALLVGLLAWIAQMFDREQAERTRLERENANAAPVLAQKLLELEQTNAELAATSDRLERSNQELQSFATVASHDLREPLRVISGFSEMLAKRYGDKLEGDGTRFLEAITSGVTRMDEMVADLLAYARAGRSDQPLEPVDLNGVVANVVADLRHAIDDAGAEVEVADLPTVTGNAPALGQLFQNLIANAIKFRGEASPRVRIWAAEVPGAWRFAVRDNGIGIDPEQAERIFTMFTRLHSANNYPGTGVGLAVCQRIVGVHGGHIWVEEAPGGGSQFMFTIARPAAL